MTMDIPRYGYIVPKDKINAFILPSSYNTKEISIEQQFNLSRTKDQTTNRVLRLNSESGKIERLFLLRNNDTHEFVLWDYRTDVLKSLISDPNNKRWEQIPDWQPKFEEVGLTKLRIWPFRLRGFSLRFVGKCRTSFSKVQRIEHFILRVAALVGAIIFLVAVVF